MGGNRKSVRLRDFSYSEARTYFLTICCENMSHYLGRKKTEGVEKIVVGDGVPDVPLPEGQKNAREIFDITKYGIVVEKKIEELSRQSTTIRIDNFVIMPNHVHFLLSVIPEEGTSGTPSPTNQFSNVSRQNEAIPKFVSYFKRSTNSLCGKNIWQRSYHDHIVQNYEDYENHYEYINNNPARWMEDEYYLQDAENQRW